MTYPARLLSIAAFLFLTIYGELALAGSWKGTAACSAGSAHPEGGGESAAGADLACKFPNAGGGGYCTSTVMCNATGNNAICNIHPSDRFACGGGALLWCNAGETKVLDDGGQSQCVEKLRMAKLVVAQL